MIEMSMGDIAAVVNGRLINCDENLLTSAFPVIDSRRSKPGTFFAAFIGQNGDGHDFIASAISNGSEFALVSKETDYPAIVVENVLEALTKLAIHVRGKLKNLKVIALTGSQGKTTTKDLLAHVLSANGIVVAPEASLNNELGVPLLILRCDLKTDFCVVEMGARHKGDIRHLASIAKPTIGIVLVVGSAHLGEFGSREIIAETKAELIESLPNDGIAILGNYDELTPHMADSLPITTLIFGENNSCDVRATDIENREGRPHFDLVSAEGRVPVSLQLLGLHQIANALGAATAAIALKIPMEVIAAALSTAELESKWRMELSEVNELSLINDSYNANPESMAAALRTLALIAQERGGQSWAFLGKMHELGASSVLEHQKIGELVVELGIDHLVSIGTKDYLSGISDEKLAQEETQLHHFSSKTEALKLVKNFSKGDVLLVKASRAEGFEILADELLNLWRAGEE